VCVVKLSCVVRTLAYVAGFVSELQLGWYVEVLGTEPRTSCPVNKRMCNYSVTKP
jgi:hypothetical protein